MDVQPLVSIVIPVFNRETLVQEAIESALKQTYDNIEIVVVDNCSTDKTWEVLQKYNNPKIKIFRNNTNIGPVLNWKKGIELSSGEYIKLLFSDDMISEDFVEESMKLFDDETAFVLSPIQFVKNGMCDSPIPLGKAIYTREEYFTNFYTQFSAEFPVSPGASIFRKIDVVNAFICEIPTMGNLDPMKNGAGIDLLIFFVIANKYDKIKVAKKSSALFRAHEGSFSIADSTISHYYFRAMIYYLQYLKNKRLYYYFKTYLLRCSLRDKSYQTEFNMLETDTSFILKLLVLLPHYYLKRAATKWQRNFRLKK